MSGDESEDERLGLLEEAYLGFVEEGLQTLGVSRRVGQPGYILVLMPLL